MSPRALLLVALGAVCGCGGADERPLGVSSYSMSPPAAVPVVRPCVDGERETCRNYLVSPDGVVDCFTGVRTCSAHEWGPCEEAKTESTELCELDERGISEPVGSGGVIARLARSAEGTQLTLSAGHAPLATIDVSVSAKGEFHVPINATRFSFRHAGDVVAVSAVRIDGRVGAECARFDAIAVTLTTAKGPLVLTGAP